MGQRRRSDSKGPLKEEKAHRGRAVVARLRGHSVNRGVCSLTANALRTTNRSSKSWNASILAD